MALENASFINQLIATNPDGTDPKGQGDDHLRLIKKVLKDTFPQFTGALTGTQDQYNAVLGEGVTMKPGMIVMFSGALNTIPAGWMLCNGSGTLSNGGPVPDLRDRFVMGSGGTTAHLFRAGSFEHSHQLSISGTALTVEQMPSHRHRVMGSTSNSWSAKAGAATPVQYGDSPPNNKAAGFAGPYTGDYNVSAAYNYFDLDGRTSVNLIENTGSGAAHTHTGTAQISNHTPPFMALAFIIKT